MIEWVKSLLEAHPKLAPYALCLSLIIAGFNVPISADLVILIGATLAATVLKGAFFKLYLAIFIGSSLAAYIAYAQGRFLAPFLLKKKFFQRLFPESRLLKIKAHYKKHAALTLILGRFIPFGFRNALFISTGLAKFPFKAFALRDALACLIWTFTAFYSLYLLVSKVDNLIPVIKKFNLLIFSLMAVSVIGLVWYKQIKKKIPAT